MDELLPYCTTQKHLVHSDFDFHNTISDGQAITGVLDWADSRLGDFLYDVAYLDFFGKGISYGDMWREYAEARGLLVPHFEERMRCYMLHEGLGSIAVAALREDRRFYIRARERTCSVLLPARRASTDWTHEVDVLP